MERKTLSAIVFILLGITPTSAEEVSFPKPIPGTTAKVCQLTGDFDRERKEPTLSRTNERFGVSGTDLGNPIEHKGRLYFLFGDTPGKGNRWMRDPIAYTTSTDPERIVLQFLVDPDGKYRPITIPGISHLVFEAPAGGISLRGTMYIVFATDHTEQKTLGRSVLAASDDDGRTFRYLYELSTDEFLEVSMAEVAPDQVKELPFSVNTVLIWGSGEYRASNPYLACVPSDKISDKSTLRYFAGLDESGKPIWKTSETDAVPLFEHRQIGEFSVVWCHQLNHWLMLYNSMNPRGIVFRSATVPWGPWSDIEVIFDPVRDGYRKFMHTPSRRDGNDDGLSDPGRETAPGGGYAPYMLKRYFRGNSKRCTIYFTLSTWNPYQVVLMRADIGYPDKESS